MRALKGAIWGVVLVVVMVTLLSASTATSSALAGATSTNVTSGAALGSADIGGTAATSGVNPSAAASAPGLAFEQKIIATAETDHIPLQAVSLPNLLSNPTKLSDGVITPSAVTPAPIGLGAYGVRNTTGTPQAFDLETQSWEGTITLNSPVNNFLLDNDGAASTNGADNEFGVQLNAVMSGVTIGTSATYSFWTQNVLYFNFPSPGTVTFLDNVWNFSSPAFNLAPGTLYSYNGTPVYPEYYYDFGPTFSITYPLTVHLYVNSSVTDLKATGDGYTTVKFGYDIVNGATGKSEASGIYDTVLFASTTPIGHVPASPYLLDGSEYTPTGYIPWDAEIMLGGPGGGTTTSVYGISGSESLQYWDGSSHRYVNAPATWNVASETGETSEGIAVSYTSPGTADLNTGPFLTTPLWNSTPGGNAGQATFAGPLSPSNAFVFASPGTQLDTNYAGWAPTQTASTVDYVLPPGTYTFAAMLSDYNPIVATVTAGKGGSALLHFDLSPNSHTGVYTPLVAWDNAQLAAISSGGHGTASSPYLLDNNAPPGGGLNPLFGQFNDYLFQVFPGVLLSGTTAYVDLVNPSLLQVTYQTGYDAALEYYGLPLTNNLQFEIFDASHVSLWGAKGITGWFFFDDYGPTGYLPLANVVVWGGSDDLIGDNTFVSQGSSLLLADYVPGPSGNVVWGNTFVNSTQLTPTMYPGDGAANGPPIAIFEFEAGDLIYNNYVATSITAYAPDANMFFGSAQLNLDNWNLSMVEPAFYAMEFNGFTLSGTIVRSVWQGGNYWADYVPGSPLPYDEYGYIESGGDFFPYPITAYSVTFELSERGPGVDWSVTVNGVTQSTTSSSLVFYETPGAYPYTATILSGKGSISPSSGTVNVVNHDLIVRLSVTGNGVFPPAHGGP
jgi:thermopsin